MTAKGAFQIMRCVASFRLYARLRGGQPSRHNLRTYALRLYGLTDPGTSLNHLMNIDHGTIILSGYFSSIRLAFAQQLQLKLYEPIIETHSEHCFPMLSTNRSNDLYSPHPISVIDYNRMAETGILELDARVELIEGEIIDMAPIGSSHASTVNRLTRELVRKAGDSALVSVQNPIILGDYSEPEPDLVLLKPKKNDYRDALPQAEDILLLIEVADSTVKYDQTIKVPLYARFGIAEFWLVNLPQQSVTIFRNPVQDQFSVATTVTTPAVLTPVLLPDINLNLSQLFSY